MEKVVLLVMCLAVAGASAQCPPCGCFPVNTTDITLSQLVEYNPLYTQVASIMSKGANQDSVCLKLTDTCTPGNVLTEQTNTFIDKTTSQRASIQTTNSTGRFFVTGPTRSYYDSILGNPCPGTYTIYRCIVTGTCVTEVAKADVIVVSTRIHDYERCIQDGIAIAQTAFPGLEFYTLPKKTIQPCPCADDS